MQKKLRTTDSDPIEKHTQEPQNRIVNGTRILMKQKTNIKGSEPQLVNLSFSFRSPKELSTRATVGQNLPRDIVHGAGKAASSRL